MKRRLLIVTILLLVVVGLVATLYIRNSNKHRTLNDSVIKTIAVDEGAALIRNCKVQEVEYGISPESVLIVLYDGTEKSVSPINANEPDKIGDAISATKSACPNATTTN